jgi:chemotaxis signal transduction protein
VSEPTSEILTFQVGTRIYATEVYDVRRIGHGTEAGLTHVSRSCLGQPLASGRGLVVTGTDEMEQALDVDRVLGIQSVPGSSIQPLPAFAAQCLGSAAVVGLVVLDESPTPLIDIPTLIREQLEISAAPREKRIPDA